MAYQLYSFTTKIASRGYHVYMHTTWEKAQVDDNVVVKIETDVNSKMIDPYCCKILTKNEEQRLVTVGHIPREISRYSGISLRRTHRKADTSIKQTRFPSEYLTSKSS